MADTYRERAPSAALGGAVRTIWVQSVGEAPAVHRHLPTGGVEIHVVVGQGARLLGPLTGHRLEVIPPRTTILGVRFRPGGAPPLPLPLEELVDQSVPLAEMWGGLADRLQHDVAAAGTLERAIGALEAFLLQRFRVGRAADPVLRAAVAALMPWRPVEVGAVAAGVGLSESQLRRRALSAVGLSPKVLQRTLRFQGFLALAQARATPSGRVGRDGIAGLAVDAGYADQAHLSRECLRLTGQTPRELLHGDVERCACGHDHSASYRPFLAGRLRAGPVPVTTV
ncbi:helix-turn-helix domain-containing protein [Microbacterium azadirachtae]|uniref:helix-turn-helix domain-containing protein n=1 Tax=Microbacterium azadirachtae TaxID=582680 RepID=UPI00088BE8C1|nr:AraC family transcriptional regulator [Microbacterium azadirachtae]SDL95316.1 AraC-type DNA-binding protein [Microbacterium azadirachtae]SEG12799.1 AraC-type DNA-binding protein [Microbacterium azadirachtae]SEG15403.1 AraC-type DNA-binding protein [Microbacterium azadirachtae]